MKTSYTEDDVLLLLKDITGLVEPQPTQERERLIQSGRHYCEMLPIEYKPSEKYMQAYEEAMKIYSKTTAIAIGHLADVIVKERGQDVVLVSLARAGIPIGILLKRYLKWKYHIACKHYSISIIRGKGIDHNAMNYILARHQPEQLLFVDGWIGKGAILNELKKDLEEFQGVSTELAVVADPANITKFCGTHEDILIPSSCLNCTVSGLISRTFLRDDIIKKDDFHGAVYYKELEAEDLSYQFINTIQSKFEKENNYSNEISRSIGMEEVRKIAQRYNIQDINLIKPGIGETTRVLLRRIPWKVLISDAYKKDSSLQHIVRLAEEKNVPIEYVELKNYKSCGIIKKMADT